MPAQPPNILFAFADDWGRYASAYRPIEGDNTPNAVLSTPHFDRIAREGALFSNAFVPAPSCTPYHSMLAAGYNALLYTLLLLCLAHPALADEPTLARVSFWIDAQQQQAFARAYDAEVVPLLKERGLIPSAIPTRTAVDGIFSRLWVAADAAAVSAAIQTLSKDPVWLGMVERLSTSFATSEADSTLRYHFGHYSTPAGLGTVSEAGPGIRHGAWRNFDDEDGLGGSAYAVMQDKQGRIWLGYDGALVYDGAQCRAYSRDDGLAANSVHAIHQDTIGNFWFATEEGISHYDGQRFETYTVEDGLTDNNVSSILEDRHGHLWFTTGHFWSRQGRGVSRYDGEKFQNFTSSDGLGADLVWAAAEDRHGHIWFATEAGMSRYDGEDFKTFTAADGLASHSFYSVIEDSEGQLWFGSGRQGVSRYDGEKFVSIAQLSTEGKLPLHPVRAIVEDRQGYLWFGLDGGGISRYDGKEIKTYDTSDGLGATQVQAMIESREGHLWITSWAGGISRYDGLILTNFADDEVMGHGGVKSLGQDTDGDIWLGGLDGRVIRYDGERFEVLADLKSAIFYILQDGRGDMWFATFGNGLTRYDGKNFKTFTSEDGLSSNSLLSLYEERDGTLWIGTYGSGLMRYDGKDFVRFTTRDGLPNDSVFSIYQDTAGLIWIGTIGGVSRYDGEHFSTFDEFPALRHHITEIVQDPAGRMWFAIWGGDPDIVYLEGPDFATITAVDTLKNTAAHRLLRDSKGHWWFSDFGGGVHRFDGTVLASMKRRDGLTDDAIQQVLEDRHGNFWIASSGGINRYRPSEQPPTIRIVAISADSLYASPRQISIASTQDLIRIQFKGGSLTTAPDKFIYRYQLKGYDPEPITTRETEVVYNDLPVGNYTFEVNAVDRDLNYSTAPAQVEVVVHWPYRLLALWCGLALALCGLLVASVSAVRRRRAFLREQQARLQAQEALNRELEEELQMAHDLQMGLMPTQSPQIKGLDMAGRCIPANHVGGDFFQYFQQDGRLTLCLADVTGHAMEAAVPVMMFSGILESEIKYDYTLIDLYTHLNQTLHRKLNNRTYVCFCMGTFDIATRSFRMANAACPYPFHYRAATGDVDELEVGAYPLGARSDSVYTDLETMVGIGDYVVFCSDGIIEAVNKQDDPFGFEQTAQCIRQSALEGLSAKALIDRLIDAVQTFVGEVPQADDMTCVVLRVEENANNN